MTCSLLWMKCLFDRFSISISDFGANWKVKLFENVFPDSATGHQTTFCDLIWWESAVAKLPKGSLDYNTKNWGSAGLVPAPMAFCPTWADRAQNPLNVVTPWHVDEYRICSRSAALCRTYSGKIIFSPKVITIIGFQPTKTVCAKWRFISQLLVVFLRVYNDISKLHEASRDFCVTAELSVITNMNYLSISI